MKHRRIPSWTSVQSVRVDTAVQLQLLARVNITASQLGSESRYTICVSSVALYNSGMDELRHLEAVPGGRRV